MIECFGVENFERELRRKTMKQQCSGQVYKREKAWGINFQPCKRIGVLEEDGRWWCRVHAPSLKKALREKRDRKWNALYEQKQADADKARLCQRIGEKVLTEIRLLETTQNIGEANWLTRLQTLVAEMKK